MEKAIRKWSQLFVRVGYRMTYFVWKFIKRYLKTRTRGAQVVVWKNERFLLVKTSYRNAYSFPGGYIKTNEIPIDAAARELKEETGICVTKEELFYLFHSVSFCGTTECIDTLFEMILDREKFNDVQIDNKEIIEAKFFGLPDLAEIELEDTVLHFLEHYSGKSNY